MAAGLVKGEGFAVDASVMEANASRYHGKAPDEVDWTDAQRQKRAVAKYLAGLESERQAQEGGDSRGGGSDGQPTPAPDRKPPKVISPSDPSSAWTAKANKRVQIRAFFSTKKHGMGMGLSIARTIVTAHNGQIEVENRNGAVFRIRLLLV